MENILNIYNHTNINNINIYLPVSFTKLLQKKQVIVRLQENFMIIKEASISDNRYFTINKNNTITYTAKNIKEYVGSHSYEIENEELIIDLNKNET